VAASTNVRALLARTSTRARLLLAITVVIAACARLALVAAALAAEDRRVTAGAVLGVGAAALYILERTVGTAGRIAVECDLHRIAARALLDGDVVAVPAEDLSRIVYDGINHGRNLLTTVLPAVVADGLTAAIVLPVLASRLAPPVLVVGLGALATASVGTLLVRRATERLEARALAAYLAVCETMAVTLEARLEVVAHGSEDAVRARLDDQLARYDRLSVRAAWGSSLLGRAPVLAAALVIGAAVTLHAGSRDAFQHLLESSALLVAAAVPPLLGAALAFHGATRALVFVRPFTALVVSPPRDDVARPGSTAPAVPGAFSAAELTFAYGRGSPATLRDVTFRWPPGEPLLVRGANGSGKSTLFRLLLGLRAPTAGRLQVDGVDLQSMDLRALRRHVAYLPQRPYLGDGHLTLRDALTLMRAAPSEPRMKAALERVQLLGLLRTDGREPLDVHVGELSAGQRQRLALARVLLQDADILLLDEPDANLDRDGIQLVGELARELTAAGKMVAIAAHSPELAALAGAPSMLVLPSRAGGAPPAAAL
jgi:ABC-type bacteriocin/lantibiotic exporter with double-glycine peptidase domain